MSDIANCGIIAEIECTVCLEAPKRETRILQCNNGHIFCQTCYFKLSKCPACRLRLASEVENGPGPIRCLIAETLIRKLPNCNASENKKENLVAINGNVIQRQFSRNKIHEQTATEISNTKPNNVSDKQKDFGVYWGRRLPMKF